MLPLLREESVQGDVDDIHPVQPIPDRLWRRGIHPGADGLLGR